MRGRGATGSRGLVPSIAAPLGSQRHCPGGFPQSVCQATARDRVTAGPCSPHLQGGPPSAPGSALRPSVITERLGLQLYLCVHHGVREPLLLPWTAAHPVDHCSSRRPLLIPPTTSHDQPESGGGFVGSIMLISVFCCLSRHPLARCRGVSAASDLDLGIILHHLASGAGCPAR